MPIVGPIKRKDLIRYLQELGFSKPESGGKHQYMLRGEQKLTIPNPHKSDISTVLLLKLLKQAEISREDWENL
jgi:predicted RNA binding protein YcfA (HicA-like mRNA interferase family)